jgi:hypothetical protein
LPRAFVVVVWDVLLWLTVLSIAEKMLLSM